MIREKAYLFFSKFNIGIWERGWSQVIILNMETPANQFEDEGGISAHFSVVS